MKAALVAQSGSERVKSKGVQVDPLHFVKKMRAIRLSLSSDRMLRQRIGVVKYLQGVRIAG